MGAVPDMTRCAREIAICLQPRSGGRNIAWGGAEGGTPGIAPNEVEPCKGGRNTLGTHFHGDIMNAARS